MIEKWKRVLLAGLLAVAVWPILRSQEEAGSERAIELLLEQQVEAWNAGDLETFMQGYWNSPQLTFFSGGTRLSGWRATLGRYRRRYQGEGRQMGRLAFEELEVRLLGADSAFVRGRYRLQMPGGEQPTGLFTLVLQRLPEGWRIIHDHTSGA